MVIASSTRESISVFAILCKILYRIPRKTYDSAIFDSLDSFYYHKKTNFLVYRFAISQVCSIVLSSKHSANVAQSVEQLTRNEQVIGSNPIIGSIFLPSPEIYSDINLPMSVKIYYCIRLNLNYWSVWLYGSSFFPCITVTGGIENRCTFNVLILG